MLSQVSGNQVNMNSNNSEARSVQTPSAISLQRLRHLNSETQLATESATAYRKKYANSHFNRFSLDTRRASTDTHNTVYHSLVDETSLAPLDLSLSNLEFAKKRMGISVQNGCSSDVLMSINVGGVKYVFRIDTLITRNNGLLSYLAKMPHHERLFYVDAYFEEGREYYFEKQPGLFNIIYQFYQGGKIHQPAQSCPQEVLDELDYWGINGNDFFSPCCCNDDEQDPDDNQTADDTAGPDPFDGICCGHMRRTLWAMMEDPTSSIFAKIFALLSVLFVLISISGLIMGSIPDLQVEVKKHRNSTSTKIEYEPHPILTHLESGCIVWFTFEYVFKMVVSPNRWATFCLLLNIIDLMAILPFMIEIGLLIFGIDTEQLQDLKGAFLVIRILRVLRVIRVLKLGRYSSGLQMFGKTLQASFRQLGMMAMVVMTGVIFFSTLVYFVEKDEPNSGFVSIPAACWWCIATMSTVGYGDLTPVTVIGKLVATGAIACGVLVLALPITIIVDNFMKVAESERKPGFVENSQVRRLGPRARVVVNAAPTPTLSLKSSSAPHRPLTSVASKDEKSMTKFIQNNSKNNA